MTDGDGQARKRVALALLEKRKELPIWSSRKSLIKLVAKHETVVLVGETGSGKTTQAPQLVQQQLQLPGMVACTQPRRVAAITVAQRVAAEQGVQVGGKVGYSVRFDDNTSEGTRIKYMTDGMLIREAIIDPKLRSYSVVFVDEAHERTVNTDVLLGLLKRAQRHRHGKRHPLKLVIMSATLDQANFLEFLEGSIPAYIEGRQFPVEVFYTREPQESYLQATVNAILQIHVDEAGGDILAFLTGQEEIEGLRSTLTNTAAALPPHPTGLRLSIAVIYAALPPDEQAAVFEAALPGFRKVVLATNIAETSVTLPGVRYVVDGGVVKARAFSAQRGIESLQVIPISQAQARQRSGRAGRDAPGKCFRLYPEAAFDALPASSVPEIQRSNLATVVLQLLAVGVTDVCSFEFLDPPPRSALEKALEMLYALEAMDTSGRLTAKGRKMACLPLDPPLAAVLLAAVKLSCTFEALAVVSMLSSDRVFLTPTKHEAEARSQHKLFCSPLGDHVTLLHVYTQYGAVAAKRSGAWCRAHFINPKALRTATDVFEQIRGQLDALTVPVTAANVSDETHDSLRQALVAGLFLNAARLQADGSFRVITSGQEVRLHPSSVLLGKKPRCIVFNEVVLTSRLYARTASVIDAAWLPRLVPRLFATARP